MPRLNPVQVIGPGTPVLAMVPAKDRSMMRDGEFILLQNVRCDDELMEARRRDSLLLAKPSWASTAAPLGAAYVNLNGSSYVVAAFSDASKVRIAVMPSSLDRWVEVTGTGQWTGPSGNNRLTDLDNHIQITVVPTHRVRNTSGTFSARNVVVFQNGEDYPRIWDPDSTNYESYTVTGAAASSGKIRLTIGAGHNFFTGDHAYVSGVGGVPNATGLWQVTKISSTVIELDGSTFAGAFTSGGTVLDRIDLLVHKPIEDIAAVGTSIASVDSYWSIAGGSSTTYPATADPLQTADFQFSDAATAPYTGTNSVIDWDITTSAAAGDIAAVKFGTGLTLGPRTIMLVEGPSVLAALKQAKIEFNTEDVAYGSIATAWITAFDPTGSDATKKQFAATIVENSTANRYWVVFDTSQLEGSICFHMRFTRQGQAPGANEQNYILFIGSVSGDIPANYEWSFNTEDSANLVEQRSHTMVALGESIGSIGGPQTVTSGTANVTAPAPTYPLSGLLPATFHYLVQNSDGANAIDGGLDGEPSHVTVYGRGPSDIDPNPNPYFWLFSAAYYDFGYNAGVRSWAKQDTSNTTVNIPLPANVTQELFNINREAPSAYHLPMPIAVAGFYTNHRMLCGGIKDATSQYALSDVYLSWERNPFRFQQRQEDDFRGGYFQVAGEDVKAFAASASAAQGAGRIYLFTNRAIYSLGDSGPYANAGVTTTELSRPFWIGPHGTVSPRSIARGYAHIYWVDQDAQVMRMGNGLPKNIGEDSISNRLDMSVISRKPNISGTFRRDRYYLAYTPALETENNRVLVWNEGMQAWESEDYETASSDFELLGIYDVSAGSFSNSRLFFFDTSGSLYAYAESNAGTIAIRFATRGYQMKGWDDWFIEECLGMATMNTGATLSVARVSRTWGADEAWTTTMSLTRTGADFASAKDTYTPTKTGTARGSQHDFEWYLDVSGTVAPETKLIRFEFRPFGATASAGKR